jgi:hypothetical protein
MANLKKLPLTFSVFYFLNLKLRDLMPQWPAYMAYLWVPYALSHHRAYFYP